MEIACKKQMKLKSSKMKLSCNSQKLSVKEQSLLGQEKEKDEMFHPMAKLQLMEFDTGQERHSTEDLRQSIRAERDLRKYQEETAAYARDLFDIVQIEREGAYSGRMSSPGRYFEQQPEASKVIRKRRDVREEESGIKAIFWDAEKKGIITQAVKKEYLRNSLCQYVPSILTSTKREDKRANIRQMLYTAKREQVPAVVFASNPHVPLLRDARYLLAEPVSAKRFSSFPVSRERTGNREAVWIGQGGLYNSNSQHMVRQQERRQQGPVLAAHREKDRGVIRQKGKGYQTSEKSPKVSSRIAAIGRKVSNQFRSQLQKDEGRKEAQEEAYRESTARTVAETQGKSPEKRVTGAIMSMLLVIKVIMKTLILKVAIVVLCIASLFMLITGLFSIISVSFGTGKAKVSNEVEFYRPYLQVEAAKYPGMSQLVDLMLAIIMQEAGGEPWIGTMDGDVMQSSESAGYPGPGYLKGEASIAQGVKYLYGVFSKTGLIEDPYNLELTKISCQSYNFGIGFYDWFAGQGHDRWTFEIAVEYAKIGAANMGWSVYRSDPALVYYAGPINYGDQRYPEHVLEYYEISFGDAFYGSGGLPIPLYYQWQYADVPYGGGNIATSGCGPTSFAMVASYLKGQEITPVDAVTWCGNAYYVPGAGTSWDYFAGACSHFGLPAPVQTYDMQAVLQALAEGKPVISSQGPGLFTSAGHFIVLRGLDSNGKVLVNDPNDNDSKNYVNRAFDMASEIHSTAASYWIFTK